MHHIAIVFILPSSIHPSIDLSIKSVFISFCLLLFLEGHFRLHYSQPHIPAFPEGSPGLSQGLSPVGHPHKIFKTMLRVNPASLLSGLDFCHLYLQCCSFSHLGPWMRTGTSKTQGSFHKLKNLLLLLHPLKPCC